MNSKKKVQLRSFINRLREIKNTRGITIKELSQISGIRYPLLRKIFNGKRDIRLSDIQKLVLALNIEIIFRPDEVVINLLD